MARPKTYNSKIHPKVASWLARHGYTDEQISESFGITRSTFYEWKKKHKEFSDALKQDKQFTDSKVEDSLFNRAMGFEYEEVHVEEITVREGKISLPATRTRTIKKTALPDVTAQIFWLKNRQPGLWRDRIDHALAGKIETKTEISLKEVDIAEVARILADAGAFKPEAK